MKPKEGEFLCQHCGRESIFAYPAEQSCPVCLRILCADCKGEPAADCPIVHYVRARELEGENWVDVTREAFLAEFRPVMHELRDPHYYDVDNSGNPGFLDPTAEFDDFEEFTEEEFLQLCFAWMFEGVFFETTAGAFRVWLEEEKVKPPAKQQALFQEALAV